MRISMDLMRPIRTPFITTTIIIADYYEYFSSYVDSACSYYEASSYGATSVLVFIIMFALCSDSLIYLLVFVLGQCFVACVCMYVLCAGCVCLL